MCGFSLRTLKTDTNPFVVSSVFLSFDTKWMVTQFPKHLRLTSMNIGYNLAVGVCGGFSPAIATLLVDNLTTYSPGLILSVLSAVSIFGIYLGSGNVSGNGSDVGVEMTPPGTLSSVV